MAISLLILRLAGLGSLSLAEISISCATTSAGTDSRVAETGEAAACIATSQTAVLELVGSGVDALDIERHEDADLAATMNVGSNAASLDDSSASEVHVFAKRVDGIGEHVLDGLALGVDSLQSLPTSSTLAAMAARAIFSA